MTAQATGAPLYGLILGGGKSRRMGKDKAALLYQGQSALQRGFSLLTDFCPRVFVSCRGDQEGEALYRDFPRITDQSRYGSGPMTGILSAMTAFPEAAWLVLACDLPLVTPRILQTLIEGREPLKSATAYVSRHDGLPEPLCAIYEPAARDIFLADHRRGGQCPRKVLMRMDAVRLVLTEDPQALENINAPADYALAEQILKGGPRDEH